MDGLGADGYLQTVLLHRNSITNKRRLKTTLVLHVLLLVLMLARLSASILVLLSIRPPQFLQLLRLPRPWVWEQLWLLSAVAVAFGFAALRRNRLLYLHQYAVGIAVFGILPTVYGIFDLSGELAEFFETHQAKRFLFGLPVVVIWNMFLAVSLQVQAFAFYFAWQLRKTWKARIELKKLKQ